MTEPTTTPPELPAPPAPHVSAARPNRPRIYELATIALIVTTDQITKAAITASLALGESMTVIPGLLDLTHVQNTGAAFGLLNTADFPYKPAIMIGIAALALVAIATYASQLGFHERLARFGLSLILGGAFGNLIDRATEGHVVDFVDVYWGSTHFWAFNVADAAITVGAAFVLLDMIGVQRDHVSNTV